MTSSCRGLTVVSQGWGQSSLALSLIKNPTENFYDPKTAGGYFIVQF